MATLTLVANEPFDHFDGATVRVSRRPGERREPLAGACPSRDFLEQASALGLSIECAVEIALELAVIESDLPEAAREILDELPMNATGGGVRYALPEASAAYLRLLIGLRPRPVPSVSHEAGLDVPYRLFPRVLGLDLDAALTPENLMRAVSLERAAAAEGRQMTEFVFRRLLDAYASANLVRPS